MRGLTRLLGLRGLKIAITLFGLGSALVAYGNYAIASHYHPDTSGLWVYLAVAAGLALVPVAAILGPPLALGGT